MFAWSDTATAGIAVAVITIIPSTIAAVNSTRAKSELKTNGGKSARDELKLIAKKLDGHVTTSNQRWNQMDSRLTALEDYITNPPRHAA